MTCPLKITVLAYTRQVTFYKNKWPCLTVLSNRFKNREQPFSISLQRGAKVCQPYCEFPLPKSHDFEKVWWNLHGILVRSGITICNLQSGNIEGLIMNFNRHWSWIIFVFFDPWGAFNAPHSATLFFYCNRFIGIQVTTRFVPRKRRKFIRFGVCFKSKNIWNHIGYSSATFFEKWLQPFWKMIATFLKNDCNLFEKWLQPFWKMIATFLKNDCNLFEKWLPPFWKMIATFLINDCNLFEKWLQPFWKMIATFLKLYQNFETLHRLWHSNVNASLPPIGR